MLTPEWGRRRSESQAIYSSIEPSIAARIGSRNIIIANPTWI
jgi:hypothetical protein